MAKIYGLFGSMTGKVADVVMTVRNGEQIVRKYQPIISNPSTQLQVAQRAKLKLLSQLSAVLGNNVAIPREGSVSSRNLFTKSNFGLTSYSDNQATINLSAIQLTKSAVAIPPVQAVRQSESSTSIDVSLSRPDPDISRVVYIALIKENDGRVRLGATSVVNDPGAQNLFTGVLSMRSARETVVLAYGVRDNTAAAHARFGELTALTSEQIAKIVVTRTLKESDITLTETVGVNVPLTTNA